MEVIAAIVLGTAVTLFVLWASARAAITVLVARVRNGKLEVVRGGIAPRVLEDVRDVVKRPRVKSATIRIVRSRGRAQLEARGDFTGAQLQQLRNVIGTVSLAQLTNSTRAKR